MALCRDLEDLTKRTLRSADERSKSIECYLKSDIEKRLVLDGLQYVGVAKDKAVHES